MQEINNVGIYCRLSRDDERTGESVSIENQKELLSRHAREQGWTIIDYYVDDGVSGTTFNRPGFKEMLADIEAGQVDMVVVKDMSRFGRNYLETGMYTEIRFPELGVRFIAINDGVDSEQDYGDFTPFRNIMNEWYAKDTSKKIKAVFHTKGMAGQRVSTKIPYGYLKGEDGKLVPDEETAPVVRMIFQLCAEGNGVGKIARILRERKINTPSTLKFLRTGQTFCYDPDDPYGWNASTVGAMLDNKEYLGHTVNFKTTKWSFKSHLIIHSPEDKQAVFENTHEALIDPETWEIVRRNRQYRHRPTKSDEIALFSGLLFCSDCGSRLAAYQVKYREITTKKYTCSKYKNSRGRQLCTIHYIREDVLEGLVLENLRKVIAYAKDYEDEFVRRVMDNTLAEQMKEQAASRRKLAQQARRIGEIDTIIQRLYEDMVTGALTRERFTKLSSAYEQEQKDLETSTTELREMVETCEQQKVNVKSFLKLVRSYTEPEQLTPEILHTFVEKIIIHNADWSSGHRTQQIDIHYNFVGQLDMSVEQTRTRRRSKEELMGQSVSNQ